MTDLAVRNGHALTTTAPDHRTALAARDTLADKIRYACEHHGRDESIDSIRLWLDKHGVPTKRTQRPYVSGKVNAWRREHPNLAAMPVDRVQDAAALRDLSVNGRVDNASTDNGSPMPVRPAGAAGFYAVAVISMAVSVDTSWRFFGTELGITNLGERSAMFAVLEAALIACGFGMRASVRRIGRPGPARLWVWALCGLAGYMALVLSGPVAGLARVALGPALGLVMLHLALGIEIRAGGHRMGTWARVGREMRERCLSRLGLADDHRDAAGRTRDRAARRVARLSLARFVPARSTRIARALRVSDVAHDPAARARMLAELAVARHAGELATLPQPSPWTVATIGGPR